MEIKQVGLLLMVALGLIVGLVLITPTADNIAQSTQTVTFSNYTVTTGTVAAPATLTGFQEVVGTYTIVNYTNAAVPPTGNVTMSSGIVNNVKVLRLVTTNASWANTRVVINATTIYPAGYIEDAGGRAIAPLVIIFGAIALAVVALLPSIKDTIALGR